MKYTKKNTGMVMIMELHTWNEMKKCVTVCETYVLASTNDRLCHVKAKRLD
jgi:hypothetical protein